MPENAVKSSRRQMLSDTLKEYGREILVVPGKCDGCGGSAGSPDCVEACRAVNKRKGVEASMITVREHNDTFIPIFCRNCSHAPCVSACMTGARNRRDSGWVETDDSRCVGCWMCIMVCPFGAIKRDGEEHTARKCDGCTSEEIPPCVSACKQGALKQISANEFTHNIRLNSAARHFLPAGIK
ncbi:MAG: hypothetical protein A7316_07105 [Candidatus Altiarchaeales archaeon WOR_SM1_86-2]|nr:MAG: hypothetical protein A7316_07105 [Candidatus Altiarchaeales archaeon WOR_SM1_86-2]